MDRHRYQKDPGRDGMCTCGQGRSENIHRMLVWRKAPSGNWVSNIAEGVVYRCRPSNPYGQRAKGSWWWAECDSVEDLKKKEGRDEEWSRISGAVGISLAEAKAVCEEHRSNR